MSAADKVVAVEALAARLAAARGRGERIVFTNGCFDLLHVGHLRLLEGARALGERLVVAVNGDQSVRRLKGAGRPIVTFVERAELLAGFAAVDWVVGFDESTPLALIELLRPDVLAKGADWEADEIVGRAEVERSGGRVVRLPLVEGHSTSGRIARIRAGARPVRPG